MAPDHAVARAASHRHRARLARRRGIGRHLLGDLLARHAGEFFLEVRESNFAARRFYEYAGFQEIAKRLQYYTNPIEAAIVMKLFSC